MPSIHFHEPDEGPFATPERITITVHPPTNTKRPIGFAPWPKPKRKKTSKRKRR